MRAAAEARLRELLGGHRMSEYRQSSRKWKPRPFRPSEALVVAVDGFEGPLDLLLTLARNQKVDIAKISVLELAEQYLEFVERAQRLNLELAADYLVMAAWLAYLKSRMLLPQPPGAEGEPTADEMAARLRWRLQRLDAMRESAARLMARDRLGREVFARGNPEAGECDPAAHPDRHALRFAHRLCDAAAEDGEGQFLSSGACAGAADRGSARAAGTDAGPDRGLERAGAAVAARLVVWGEAALGAGEHVARLPGTGAGRADRDSPAQALRRGVCKRPRGVAGRGGGIMNRVVRLRDIQPEAENEDVPDIESPDVDARTQVNSEHLRMMEALLFAASEPLDAQALATSLPQGANVPMLLGGASTHL